MNRFHIHLPYIFSALLLAASFSAAAFDTSVYADNSVLAQGKWVKISIPADGLYRLPASTLRSWGFTDFSRVAVRGYGGRRLADKLSQSDYIDDLPLVQTIADSRGVTFYGVGAGQWKDSGGYSYYRQNDMSSEGHYFVGLLPDTVAAREIPLSGGADDNFAGSTSSFSQNVQHETERLIIPGEAGPLLVGEDFRYTRSRTFSFSVPGLANDDVQATLRASFISNITGSGASVAFKVNGTKLDSKPSDKIASTSTSEYIHGTETVTHHSFFIKPTAKGTVDITVEFIPGGKVEGIWLNYLVISYPRLISIPSEGHLQFSIQRTEFNVANATEGIRVLDVTDPKAITEFDKGKFIDEKTAAYALAKGSPVKRRQFVAWNPDAKLPAPKTVGFVSSQNLHAHKYADMVIITPSAFSAAAHRLADHHAKADSMEVIVVTPEEVYNEFSSGTTDPGAFRRFFKMLYDRGNASGRPLRYAILMARTSLDNRGLTETASTSPVIPSWMPETEAASLSDNLGYCTDDIIGMLADNSGQRLGTDKIDIAIGRLPVTTSAEANSVVDKLLEYAKGKRRTAWKQRFMFLADDQDGGVHLTQTEKMLSKFAGGDSPFLIKKVYMDAYQFEGSVYPAAREAMFRNLDEGVVWWNFIGHANISEWTHEHQLSYTDLNNMYLRHWPFIYAATCNFLRIDGSAITGGELMFKERYGGAIGIISAVRPVYITDNGLLSNALGRAFAIRDDSRRLLTPGEMYRRAKNDIRNDHDEPVSDTNRLRYVFIGDPALPLASPSNRIVLDSINGQPLDQIDQPTLAALQRATLGGHITDPDGMELSGFNGTVSIDIFDAERTVTTYGHGETGKVLNFEDIGERIFSGSAKVTDGKFTLNVAMPLEIAQNFRPATVLLYACDTTDDTEASGIDRSIYAYGYDEQAPVDNTPPVIESMVLNHEDFTDGGTVNTSPMLIASIRDDVGINISSAGVGHMMTATLDGKKTITGLSNYYTPSADGSPSGILNYPLSDIAPGAHSLRLRVWDTSGNAAERSIDFFVSEGIAPHIYEIYSDANPASTQANFYLRHNQPDSHVTVTVTVYNLVGRPLWQSTVKGRSDMFVTMPITWDLTDSSGSRVGRGIYLYRASITTDGINYETASHRIAVTAR